MPPLENTTSSMSCQANPPTELVKSQHTGESPRSPTCFNTCFSSVHSVFSSCLENTDSVSIQNFPCEDLESQEAYHAKEVTVEQCLADAGHQERIQHDKLRRRLSYSNKWWNVSLHKRFSTNWRDKFTDIKFLETVTEEDPRYESFEPHFGIPEINASTDFITKLSEFAGIDIPDYLMKEAEGLGALFIALKDCTSFSQFSAITFLYVRSHYSASISSTVCAYLEEVFSTPELQATELEEQSGLEIPNWLNVLREAQECWSLCKGNRAFKQLSKLLSILVTLGLCDASHLQFDIAGFKLFTDDLTKVHMSAFDMADALFSTITFFAEGMYLSFKTGSIKPLLMNDCAALELDSEYAKIMSWWDLVKNGNLMRVTGVDDSEFDRRLESLCNNLRNLVGTLKGLDKKIVSDKYMKCLSLKNDFITLKMSSGMRKAPFAIELFGESSQGKTTLGDQILDALLTSAGLPIDKRYRASYNPGDKFMSSWTSDKLVLLFDDVANEKSNYVEKPPTRPIIDVCNNQMYYAPKAELESKGKCFVEPEIALVNTNVKHLDAGTYMNCPYATQRRMHLVITVVAKARYQRIVDGITCGIDSSKIRKEYTIDGVYTPPSIDDIWDLTVERAVKPQSLRTIAGYKVETFRGKLMEKVSSREVIQMCIERYTEHRVDQTCIMDSMRMRQDTMEVCGFEDCNQIKGYCDQHDHLVPHFGLELAICAEKFRRKIVKKTTVEVSSFFEPLETMATTALYAASATFLARWDWMCLLPQPALEHEYFRAFALWYWSDTIKSYWLTVTLTVWVFGLLTCIIYPMISPLVIAFCLYQQMFATESAKKRLMDELETRNDSIAPTIKSFRDGNAKVLCSSVMAIGILYALAKVYKSWKSLHEDHGSLEPKTEADIAQRDAEENVWTQVVARPLPISSVSKCVSVDMLSGIVEKNLVYGSVETKDSVLMVNSLFLTSNLCILPNHYFSLSGSSELLVTFRKVNPETSGGKFRTRLSEASSVKIPGTDLCLCYSSTGGSFRDLTKHFPLENLPDHPFTMVWRQKSGPVITARGRTIAMAKATNTVEVFPGGEYKSLTMDTFKGLCGGVLISETRGSVISGFHLGGKSGTPLGCYGYLSQSMLNEAREQLRKLEGVIVSGSIDKFEPQILGVKVLTDKPLHFKSPLNFMPENSQVQYYGSCPGGVTTYTEVKKTPISPLVTDVCAVPNTWGPPKHSPQWWGWQKCLGSLSNPAAPYPHDLLSVSIQNYKKPLLKKLKLPIWAKMRPLDDSENLSGIAGVKFIDGIKLSTSIGYPLSGVKRKFVIELPATKEKPSNRIFEDVIIDEIERNLNLYKQGYRAFTITKACKKDEVLSVAKDKCRIFYGNPIAQTFLIRRYFLPILRFLQMNPITSEGAVGINCHGPEWEEFHQHVMKHGEDTLFGGDYGKYDQKLPSQLLFASLRILIDFARECDYSEEDLSIMETMTGDIVFALIAYNGDLIGLTEGTHISGNSLTVGLNGICGSLNLRCFFYTMYPHSIDFREAASMMTYGDDNIGSVSPMYPKFNIKDCSIFLEEYGQTYTMPDKESELRPYLRPEEFEFLKRTSVYHPELNGHLGALTEDSIFKSLHCFMRGKREENSEDLACALNIDGALREWFNHGEEVYEKRRLQMQEVASRGVVAHLCDDLEKTYLDRVHAWKEDNP